MKFICSVASAGEAVDFYSNQDLLDFLNSPALLSDHLDFSVSKNPVNSGYKLFYSDSDLSSVIYSSKQCRLNYPWSKMNSGETLLYAAYPLFEAQRQSQGWLTAYSAAVSVGDNGILLLGKSGAGKTSIAVDLCRRYGAQLIGNDLTIIGRQAGKMFVKGGTKFLFLRFESVKRSLPDLIDLFPHQPIEPWLCKIKVNPAEIGVSVRTLPVEIKQIFSVHIDENLSSVHVQDSQGLATKLFLIENFSRYIRGSCINILGGTAFDQLGFIPSYDNERFFKFRCELIELVLEKTKYISGPLYLVTDYIIKNNV